MSDSSRYAARGVSASKSEVHEAIKGQDAGLFPEAFCKIIPDYAGGEEEYCNIMHADTAGTKPSLAYLYWKETGDLSVWEGIAQDAIVMNLDDMACVGVTDDIILNSTIGRNKHLITGDVIRTVIQAASKFCDIMADHGVSIHLSGGETADVGDIVRTIDVGYTAFARMKRKDLLVNNIQDGDVIVGLASYGQASYEDAYNSGIGSNGLTSARHDVFHNEYTDKYPESYDPNTDKKYIYTGNNSLTDEMIIDGKSISVGKLTLSPTRTYVPIIHKVLEEHKKRIHGIIHNTGGAHTKCLKFIKNKKVIKDNLLPVPPLFSLIRESSGTPNREMFTVFNMGTRLEFYTDENTAAEIIEISKSFNVDAQIIGRVEENQNGNSLELSHEGETYRY